MIRDVTTDVRFVHIQFRQHGEHGGQHDDTVFATCYGQRCNCDCAARHQHGKQTLGVVDPKTPNPSPTDPGPTPRRLSVCLGQVCSRLEDVHELAAREASDDR